MHHHLPACSSRLEAILKDLPDLSKPRAGLNTKLQILVGRSQTSTASSSPMGTPGTNSKRQIVVGVPAPHQQAPRCQSALLDVKLQIAVGTPRPASTRSLPQAPSKRQIAVGRTTPQQQVPDHYRFSTANSRSHWALRACPPLPG